MIFWDPKRLGLEWGSEMVGILGLEWFLDPILDPSVAMLICHKIASKQSTVPLIGRLYEDFGVWTLNHLQGWELFGQLIWAVYEGLRLETFGSIYFLDGSNIKKTLTYMLLNVHP